LPAVFVRSRATPLNDSIDRQKFRRKIPRHAAGQKLVPKFTTGLEVWRIVTGKVTSAEQIAARDKCSMTISLVFLTSDLVRAAVEGRLPRGIGIARLRDAPAEWSSQYRMLGLTS